MPRHTLTPRQVMALPPGIHSDGDCLTLRIKAAKDGRSESASWVFRYTKPNGKRGELGLGSADRTNPEAAGASLRRARARADAARNLLAAGKDPIESKKGSRNEARQAEIERKANAKSSATTLLRYARAYHEKNVEPVRTDKHGKQWIASIEQHVPKDLLAKPIDQIKAIELLDELVPILRKVPETGSRVYQRLSTIFDAAVIDGLRPDNPATPILKELRKRAGRRERGNFASMPYRQVPDLISDLAAVKGNSARCLEFAILTAARTSEALTAAWSEFDLQARIWTIPAAKMKGRQAHVVFLSERAAAIVEAQKGQHATVVFPSPANSEAPMSNMALAMMLRRARGKGATVHGFRSTFSTWANELGIARPDVIEAALAHNEQDRVRKAYNRSEFLQERAALMISWADYLAGRPVTRMDGSPVTDATVLHFPAPQAVAQAA